MAQQTTVTLTDDLDGGKAAETVSFGLDGRVYEIDLSKKNAAALRKALGEFTASARRVRSGRSAVKAAKSSERVDAKAIREWAQENGYQVSARGRVPADVVERFQEANG
jgi:intergrase/recombinase